MIRTVLVSVAIPAAIMAPVFGMAFTVKAFYKPSVPQAGSAISEERLALYNRAVEDFQPVACQGARTPERMEECSLQASELAWVVSGQAMSLRK